MSVLTLVQVFFWSGLAVLAVSVAAMLGKFENSIGAIIAACLITAIATAPALLLFDVIFEGQSP